jgi:hypothetical protein
MVCQIAQSPQSLPSPQFLKNQPTKQHPQSSSYSKHVLRFAAGTVVTGALIGSALAVNSFMATKTPIIPAIFDRKHFILIGGKGSVFMDGVCGAAIGLGLGIYLGVSTRQAMLSKPGDTACFLIMGSTVSALTAMILPILHEHCTIS